MCITDGVVPRRDNPSGNPVFDTRLRSSSGWRGSRSAEEDVLEAGGGPQKRATLHSFQKPDQEGSGRQTVVEPNSIFSGIVCKTEVEYTNSIIETLEKGAVLATKEYV